MTAASRKRWNEANPEKMRQYRAGWRERNHETSLACTAAWARNNPEANREKNRKWHAANKDRNNARALKWQRDNPERAAATHRAWKQTNPDKVCLYTRRRKAALLKVGGDHTSEDIARIRALQKNRCAYCRVDLRKIKSHVDHILPLAGGGDNSRSNLQILCKDCNLTKGIRHPVDFARLTGRLI